EYLVKVAQHRRYLADETRGVQDSPALKPTQPARKPNTTAPKAPSRGPLLPVVIKEPESGKYQPLPEVPREGKDKVTKEQVAHDLLTKDQMGSNAGAQAEDQTGSDAGAQAKGQAGSNPNETSEGQAGSNPDETSEGQARLDPGDAEAK
nr:hypothetical protein [Tanacetum cinerariifolium]